jgi:transcription elongation GreA/GreB family factor
MSRAFVREQDGGDTFERVPDRPVSPHPNFVTPEGLAAIETEIARLQGEQAAAQADANGATLAQIARDLRYWLSRRASAQVMAEPEDTAVVRFGSTVTILREDGRRQTFRIVGEDEAEPVRGTLSYVSPVARALIGRTVGDEVRAGNSDITILEIA